MVSRYSQRYRLCGVHLYADALTLCPGAPLVRFCQARACASPRSGRFPDSTPCFSNNIVLPPAQKCSTLHPLGAFEGVKRTCEAQLELQRVRRGSKGKGGQSGSHSASPPSPLSDWETGPSSGAASLVAQACASSAPGEQTSSELASLMRLWHEEDALAASAGGSPHGSADCEQGDGWHVDVRLKLDSMAPTQLPESLRSALMQLLEPGCAGVHAAVTPGCTLLTLCGLGGVRYADATDAARALLRGPAASFFSALPKWTLAMRRGDEGACIERGVVRRGGPSPTTATPAPPLPALPRALNSALTTTVRLTGAKLPTNWDLRCRLHGQQVALHTTTSALTFQPCNASGVAFLEIAPAAETLKLHGGTPRAVLFTTSAAIAAEVSSDPAADPTGEEAMQRVVTCVGHALRSGPRTHSTLLHAACRASLARGWRATAAALLAHCAEADSERQSDVIDVAPSEALPMLLRAALCGTAPDASARLLLEAYPGGAHAAWVLGGASQLACARRLTALDELDASVRLDLAAASHRLAQECLDCEQPVAAAAAPAARLEARRAALRSAREFLDLSGDSLAAALAVHAQAALPPQPPASPRRLRLRLPSLRMPGAFADRDQEAAWLAHSALLTRFADTASYPMAAAVHAAQALSVWRRGGGIPHAGQAAYIFTLLCCCPALVLLAPAWFARHREALHAAMRLAGSLVLPVWVLDARGGAGVSLEQQVATLVGMAFFSTAVMVRFPLHAAIQAVSFAITVGALGITTFLRLRLAIALVNLVAVFAWERRSRRRFARLWNAPKRD